MTNWNTMHWFPPKPLIVNEPTEYQCSFWLQETIRLNQDRPSLISWNLEKEESLEWAGLKGVIACLSKSEVCFICPFRSKYLLSFLSKLYFDISWKIFQTGQDWITYLKVVWDSHFITDILEPNWSSQICWSPSKRSAGTTSGTLVGNHSGLRLTLWITSGQEEYYLDWALKTKL